VDPGLASSSGLSDEELTVAEENNNGEGAITVIDFLEWLNIASMATSDAALLVGVVMIVLLLMGYPMMVLLTVGALLLLMAKFSGLHPSNLVQQMIGGVEQTVLVAVPMFILAADIMIKGNTANRLLDVVSKFVGHIRGGLPVTHCFLHHVRRGFRFDPGHGCGHGATTQAQAD